MILTSKKALFYSGRTAHIMLIYDIHNSVQLLPSKLWSAGGSLLKIGASTVNTVLLHIETAFEKECANFRITIINTIKIYDMTKGPGPLTIVALGFTNL